MEVTKDEIYSLLQSTVMFQALPSDVLSNVAAAVQPVTVSAGQIIATEGDVGQSLFVVVRGLVRLDKGAQPLWELGSGEVFGEMSILQASERAGTVVAVEDTLLLELGRDVFLDLLHTRSDALQGVVLEYARRLRRYMTEFGTLRYQHENVILPLGIQLASEDEPDRLIERYLIEAMKLSGADSGLILLRSEDDFLDYAVHRIDSMKLNLGGTSGQEIAYPRLALTGSKEDEMSEQDVATWVAITGNMVNVPDIAVNNAFDFSATKARDLELGYQSRSCLTVPLKHPDRSVIGVLQLFNALAPDTGVVTPFDSYHQLLVESLTSMAAAALNARTLMRDEEKLAKLEQDLQVARRIQSGFLPSSLPQIEGWEIAASFEPAREVAGDFYDSFEMTQNRRIGFVIGDVVDKGVPAALFMSLVRSLTRAFAQQNYSLDWSSMFDDKSEADFAPRRTRTVPSAGTMSLYNAVALTNKYILDNHIEDNMFATLFFGMLDPTTGRVFYINAGHNPPVLLDSNGNVKAKLTNTGAAVGMFPNVDYKIETIKMEPGDLLFTYTDGVTEARDVSGEFLTETGMLHLLSRPIGSADSTLAYVQSELHRFTQGAVQADDITMLAVRRTTDSSPSESP